MKAWVGAVALMGMLGSGAAMAAGWDGNTLLGECQSAIRLLDNVRKPSDSDYDSGMCLGQVAGVRYMMSDSGDYSACFPEGGISNTQAARIVVKYLKDNPAILHNEGRFLILLAFHNAYPCK
ncbi:hypothetical protein CRX42_13765 [Pseudomonas jessenii]|uniref:Rap1a immunity protein domain-containing protein n=1 Tax=Pseudomonas jessenii TaxID=77298 RepID=A0A2W0EWF0_PSEJE|nr:Rap1a/Tai family immunity protein [Pseudomonas jessenii]PYY69968.1 hypothetical protein CRX42_13765 [Pseudomonas jessenii]